MIAVDARFLVAVPTPLAPIALFVAPDSLFDVLPAYAAALGQEVQAVIGVIPAEELAIQWVHLPVPRSRNDAAHFEPLRHLTLAPATTLYLGLVHQTDGLAGTRARIAAAARVVPNFGIAAECGLGRRDPATIRDFLKLHVAAAD